MPATGTINGGQSATIAVVPVAIAVGGKGRAGSISIAIH
jgi:hypothetical protein